MQVHIWLTQVYFWLVNSICAALVLRPKAFLNCCLTLQDAESAPTEIWNKHFWRPAFAERVESYSVLVSSSQSPDEFHTEMYAAMLSIVAVDLRKRCAGNRNYGAFVDDIVLLEQCSQEPDDDADSASMLQKTFVGNVFREDNAKWVACMCFASM